MTMVIINNDNTVVDDGILNENPTPLEIKQSLAQLKLNGINKKKESELNQTQITHDSSDQENQKPNQNGTNKKMSKNKKGGKKISLTPSFFGGRRGRNPSQSENGTETDNNQSDVSGIIGVKDYIPNAEKNKSTKNGRPRPENDEIEPTEKLFVGKLPLSLTEAELMEHFTQFGVVTEAIIKDQRGFGFVTFSTIQEADQALEAKTHIISDSEIEVKRAMPNRFQSQTQSQPLIEGYPGMDSMPTFIPGPYPTSHLMYPGTPMYVFQPGLPGFVPPVIESPLEDNTVMPLEDELSNGSSSRPARKEMRKDDGFENDLNQQKKLFIGGLHWKTEDSDLREYFSKKGTVTDAMVIKEPNSNRSRGFGFVVFSNAEDAESVFEEKERHRINGKEVDVKRAISKDEDNQNLAHLQVDKIFVGGISSNTSKESMVNYFKEKFNGKVTRVDMKINQTGENKGFAFLTFDSTEVVDEICENRYHRIGPHMVEVKKAQSKHEQKSSHNDNNNGPNSYNSTAYYGNSPHSQGGGAYGEAASYYPNPIPTFYIPTFPTLPGTYSDSGDYIGGTWYPKQQGTLESDDIANQTPPYVPQAIYYPTLPPYPGTPYAAFPSYPAAFVQPQKDI